MPVIDATETRSTAPPMFVTITDRGTRGPRWVHARTQPLDRYERAEDRAPGDHHQPLDALLAPRPMIDTTSDDRKWAEINQPPKAIAANGGSGNKPQLDKDAADKHIPVPGLCVRIGTLPTSRYARARTPTTSAASAATGFVNGHPSLWMGLSHSSSGRFSASRSHRRPSDGPITAWAVIACRESSSRADATP